MSEAVLILRNMRGGCATVDNKVHALFRVTSRGPAPIVKLDDSGTNSREASESASAAG